MGFQRGGTDLLWYFLLSHPDVCRTQGETHQVFRGRWGTTGTGNRRYHVARNLAALARGFPLLLMQREDVFSQHAMRARRPFGRFAAWYVDKMLFEAKMRAREPNQNRYKFPGVLYTLDEIRRARLLCKNVDGVIFLTSNLHRMYPDATFVAIVRNGFAVCEGHMRRGTPVDEAAVIYEKGCARIIADSEKYDNFAVIRFEDLLAEPESVLRVAFEACGLDVDSVERFRFFVKRTVGETRDRPTPGNLAAGEQAWCRMDELGRYLQRDVNTAQINRLSDDDKLTIARIARGSLEHFGYV